MFRNTALIVCLFILSGVALAQDDPPAEAPKIDPLTGQPVQAVQAVQAEEDPSAAQPVGPDLSPINELILDGIYHEAEAELDKILAEFPDNPDVVLLYGEVLLAQRKLEPAVTALEKCVALDPDRPRLHFQLGSALAQLGQNDRALEEFAMELERNEDKKILVNARLNRTAIYGQLKDWSAAAGELEAVIALDPAQTQAYGDLVSFYLQAGSLDEATAALERGAEVGFASAPHYYSLGARLYRAERLEEAGVAFTSALEVDPQFARAERSLGNVFERLGESEEAVVHFKRYLELAPDAPDAQRITDLIARAENG